MSFFLFGDAILCNSFLWAQVQDCLIELKENLSIEITVSRTSWSLPCTGWHPPPHTFANDQSTLSRGNRELHSLDTGSCRVWKLQSWLEPHLLVLSYIKDERSCHPLCLVFTTNSTDIHFNHTTQRTSSLQLVCITLLIGHPVCNLYAYSHAYLLSM